MATEPAAPDPPPPPPPKHKLIGAGLHLKDDAGLVKRQATILDVFPSGNSGVGDLLLVQYFEWVGGAPAFRQLVPLHDLTGDQWVLYASVDEMKEHYERIDKPRADEAERQKDAEEK